MHNFRALTFSWAFFVASSTAISFTSTGNPILADGSYYSADPAPLIVNDTLYIISGRDSAEIDNNAFIINEWMLWSTKAATPKGGDWTLEPDFQLPHFLFNWAAEGGAYASQIVQGHDGRFYMYSPVRQASTSDQDPFGIGVAVADSVVGPYKDIRPTGPIVSQSYPAPGNNIENIDPTVLVDEDDGKTYMYWGTFGALRGVELETDMMTFASDVIEVTSLPGFFEAPWLMKRNGVFYLLYADNRAGPDSKCTPTVYHACISYGTSSSPLGPWTYQDVILGIVSSTTSHPGTVQFNGQWYIIYHTADAVDGGNFRRSIAWDEMFFDDSSSPARIQPIEQTRRPAPPSAPTRNRQQLAVVSTSPEPSVVYWTAALNDQKTPGAPLPPQYWSSYVGDNNQAECTLTYSWETAQTLNGTSMVFFADQPAGSTVGVAPPMKWSVQYLDSNGGWTDVRNDTNYPLGVTPTPDEVAFEEVTTTGLRALLSASTNGVSAAGLGVIEWNALSTTLL